MYFTLINKVNIKQKFENFIDVAIHYGPQQISFDAGVAYCKEHDGVLLTKHLLLKSDRQ